jgi:hypothetical protein
MSPIIFLEKSCVLAEATELYQAFLWSEGRGGGREGEGEERRGRGRGRGEERRGEERRGYHDGSGDTMQLRGS